MASSCEEALRRLLMVFARLNVPIATEKLEGPTRTLTFLGIEMDTVAMSLRLGGETILHPEGTRVPGWKVTACV